MQPGENIAVIDMGTNTFHLLITNSENLFGDKVFSQKVPVKIGENGISKGIISEEAIQRAIITLKFFKEKIEEYNVKRVKAIATSAFRNASNGKEVANKIYSESGITVEIIDGDLEALLIYEGVSKAVTIDTNNSVIMDIGGGSVEFIICNNEKVFWKKSFEVGGQRLNDKFHGMDPIPNDQLKLMYEYLNTQLKELIKVINIYSPNTLIGSSGSFDTLCEIHNIKSNDDFSLERQTEYFLPIDSYHQIATELIQKDRSERLQIPGMVEMRVDMIVVSCSLINFLLDNSKIKNIQVSTYALKEGLLSRIINP